MLSFLLLFGLMLSGNSLMGQQASQQLTTTFAGGNGHDGNMFNVVPQKTVIIRNFGVNLDGTGSNDVEIYYRQGGWVSNNTGWTSAGSYNVTGQGAGNETFVSANLNLTINAGDTVGFYITVNDSTSADQLDYTNGNINQYSNSDLTLLDGIGLGYFFGSTFSPRSWNGTIYYDFPSGPNDVGISSLINPKDGCGLGSNITPEVQLFNYGTNNLAAGDTIPIQYQLNGGNVYTDTHVLASQLDTFTSDTVTLANAFDFSNGGSYDFKAWSAFGPDTVYLNDTLNTIVTNPTVTNFPFLEDLDGAANGFSTTWNNVSYDNQDWEKDSTQTTSSNTGPDGDHGGNGNHGSGNYYHIDATDASSSVDTWTLESPCLDLSGGNCPTFEFWYHMYGGDMGDLNVEVDSGGGWTSEFVLTGQQQTSSSASWKRAEIDLSGYAGVNDVRIRLVATTSGNGYQGDVAIDDLNVIEGLNKDLAVNSLVTPVSGQCGLGSNETVKINIGNKGCDTIYSNTSIPVSYEIDGGVVNDTFTLMKDLGRFDTAHFDFSQKGDFSAGGKYDIVAKVNWINDQNIGNDQDTFTVVNPAVTNFPFNENFDGSGNNFINTWSNVSYDNEDWEENSGTTVSSNTGPNGDHDGGGNHGNGNYYHIDASDASSSVDTWTLESPCLDLSGGNCPTFEFWYHMYGVAMGDLTVEVDTGSGWNSEFSLTGQQQSSSSASWKKASIDLSGYTGYNNVKIRINGVTSGNGYEGDIAIDDLNVIDGLSFDLAVEQLVYPQNDVCGSKSTPVRVVVSNLSCTDTITQLPLKANITGAVSSSLDDTFSANLLPFQTDTFTFSNNLNTMSGGDFTIEVINKIAEDTLNQSNDTLTKNIFIDSIPSAPTVIADSACFGNSVELIASDSSGNSTFGWFDGKGSNAQSLAVGDTFYTPPYFGNDSFFVEVLPSQLSPITITELELGSTDEIEVQNILDQSFDASGWFIAVSDDYTDINQVNPDVWQLGNFQAQQIKVRDDNNWGSNIFWNNSDNGWAIVIDDKGNVRDFVAWGHSASDINGLNTTVNNTSITISSYQWSGNGALSCSSGTVQRKGNSDHNDSTDFGCANNNIGSQNTNFSLPGIHPDSISTWNCSSDRVGVSPETISSGFSGLKTTQPFEGTENAGSNSDPDVYCVGDTGTYEIAPPQGYSNADLGNDWSIDSVTFKAENGYQPSDTLVQFSNGTDNSVLQYVSTSNELDSLIKIAAYVSLDDEGCDTVLQRYVQVSGQVVADFEVKDVCSDSTQFVNNSTPANVGLSYKWEFGDDSTATDSTPLHYYANKPQNYDVKLNVTGGGCSDQTTKTINIKKETEAKFAILGDECQNTLINFSDSSVYKGSGGVTHSWDFGNGDSSSMASPSNTYSQDGSYDAKLVIEGGNGCKDSFAKALKIQPIPQSDFTFNDGCVGEDVDFTNNTSFSGNDTLNYIWHFPNGTTYNTTDVTHDFDTAGNFDITLVSEVAGSPCDDTVTKQIDIQPIPKVEFGALERCFDSDIQFLDSTTYQGSGNLTHSWDFGDGNASSFPDPTHQYNSPGYYEVTHAVETNLGCSDTLTDSVEAYAYPQPDFDYTNSCFGTEVQFSDDTKLSVGDKNALSYSWDFDGLGSSGQKDPSFQFPQEDTYSVTLEASYRNQCSATIQKSINVLESPEADFNWTGTCVGQSTQFEYISSSAYSYHWDFGDGESDTAENPVYVYQTAGTYDVTVAVTYDSGACGDTLTQQVKIDETPEADFNIPDTLCQGEDVAFVNSSTQNNTNPTYTWNFGDGSMSGQENPVHQYQDSGNYNVSLVAEGSNGCNDTVSKNIPIGGRPESDFNYSKISNLTYEFTPADSNLAAYQWDFDNGTKLGVPQPTIEFEQKDEYDVQLVVYNQSGCSDTTVKSLDLTTSIGNAQTLKTGADVYPTPFKGATTLHYRTSTEAKVSMKILNSTGQVVGQYNEGILKPGGYEFRISENEHLDGPGVYFIEINIGNETFIREIVNAR